MEYYKVAGNRVGTSYRPCPKTCQSLFKDPLRSCHPRYWDWVAMRYRRCNFMEDVQSPIPQPTFSHSYLQRKNVIVKKVHSPILDVLPLNRSMRGIVIVIVARHLY